MARTEGEKRAVQRYNARTYDLISIRFAKGQHGKLKQCAEAAGVSLNKLLVKAIEAQILGREQNIAARPDGHYVFIPDVVWNDLSSMLGCDAEGITAYVLHILELQLDHNLHRR